MPAFASSTSSSNIADAVVVVHGFGGKRLWMWPLCWRLRCSGFRVVNWSYNSYFGSIENHARRFREYLDESLGSEVRVHIVAHSMGSIVVRAALANGNMERVGRIVFIAPPHQGTPVARCVAPFLGFACRAILELSDRCDSLVNRLPTAVSAEVGVIAARYDLLVPVSKTHVADEREHLVLAATHNSLLVARSAAEMTANFLRSGKFKTAEPSK